MTLFKNLYFPWSLENTEEQNHSVELLSANKQCKKTSLIGSTHPPHVNVYCPKESFINNKKKCATQSFSAVKAN